jgi:hypothetical protein
MNATNLEVAHKDGNMDCNMIVELLTDGSPDCPLIRIFGTYRRDFLRFRAIATFLGDHKDRRVSLKQEGFRMINLSDLVLMNVGDEGVICEATACSLKLSQDGWHFIAMLADGLLELPDDRDGHQWLVGLDAIEPLKSDSMAVVLSKSETGTW